MEMTDYTKGVVSMYDPVMETPDFFWYVDEEYNEVWRYQYWDVVVKAPNGSVSIDLKGKYTEELRGLVNDVIRPFEILVSEDNEWILKVGKKAYPFQDKVKVFSNYKVSFDRMPKRKKFNSNKDERIYNDRQRLLRKRAKVELEYRMKMREFEATKKKWKKEDLDIQEGKKRFLETEDYDQHKYDDRPVVGEDFEEGEKKSRKRYNDKEGQDRAFELLHDDEERDREWKELQKTVEGD